ncbi:MAG: tetratricopeptide repeat protein [Cyanobacteria bacterium]|nr:tetratricopeptide repeat protein [Cyanobacteriota bacterium]
MSTEQICGEVLDARTDIFSFGAVFWEMLTGQPPFGGKTSALVFDEILHRDPVAPSAISPVVPAAVDAIVARALQKNRNRRYQSFSELLMDLRQAPVTANVSGPSPAIVGTTATVARPRTRKPDSTRSRGLHALAVLPFANTANDPEIDYLSDGITETIINKLSQIGGLRVVPRSTVFRYKGREIDPVAAGAELKAKSVVTGRVLQRSGRLVVTVELINVRRHAQLWGEQYNRTAHDVLDVQQSIAAEVSTALELKLTGDDRQKLARRDTQDSAAYQAYIKGRFYWNKRTIDGLLQAIEHFQAAIEHDPHYARALAGLADTFNILGYYNGRPPADVYPQGKAAAARALEIDPAMAEAHASLGYARLFFDRDWPGAEQCFLEAIRLNPGYASAHQWYGWLLMVTRRWDEMMESMQRAHDLDPLSLVINEHYGYALSLVGRADEALAHLQTTVDLEPHFALAHLRIGAVHLSQGRMDDAIASLRTAVQLSSGQFAVGALGYVLALSGQRAEAEQLLAQLRERSQRVFVSPLESAYIYAGLDRADETFDALDQAVAQRISDVVRVDFLPWTPAIRSDPRFASLLATIGLPGKH